MLVSLIRATAFTTVAVDAACVTIPTTYVNQTTCNGNTYTYQELAGCGFVPSNACDQYGDTIGGMGSAIALDRSKWTKNADGSYPGARWTLPDRGCECISSTSRSLLSHGSESFSADSPSYYVNNAAGNNVYPANNPTGRDSNQGFERLTITGDGRNLYMLLQSAANQEGGLTKQTSRYARLLKYDISNPNEAPRYAREFVVPLPFWTDPTAKASKNAKVAAQSEIYHIQNGPFLVLARDSGAGHAQSSSLSIYRHIDVFDTAGATDAKGAGVLDADVPPTAYCAFLAFNVNAQLGRFGLHNGGAQDAGLLDEKCESIALVLVDGSHGEADANGEYFVFSLSDNDFITQKGFLNSGNFTYRDASGYHLDNQALVFKVQLPQGSRPWG